MSFGGSAPSLIFPKLMRSDMCFFGVCMAMDRNRRSARNSLTQLQQLRCFARDSAVNYGMLSYGKLNAFGTITRPAGSDRRARASMQEPERRRSPAPVIT